MHPMNMSINNFTDSIGYVVVFSQHMRHEKASLVVSHNITEGHLQIRLLQIRLRHTSDILVHELAPVMRSWSFIRLCDMQSPDRHQRSGSRAKN
jgi:hypothetical protein